LITALPRCVFTLLFLALLAGCAGPEGQGTASRKIKVLVVTGGHAFKPDPFFKMFQDDPDITFETAKQDKAAEAYDRDDLLTFDAVVLYDAPRNITDAQKAKFLSLFDHGVGVVVLHHAYLAYPTWHEFERIAGGSYVYTQEQLDAGLPSSHYKGNVDIPMKIVARHHPVTAGLSDFVLHDELYWDMHMLPGNTPLVETTGGELIAWTRNEKKSRVVGIIVGHGQSAYENPNFLRLLYQSIRWTARK
jgi:type 1 glutamine amidotransferase